MRILRPLAWAMILVAGFVYVTSMTHWDFARVRSMGRMWSEPAAAASSYSSDEQNNIDIKEARDATVNITVDNVCAGLVYAGIPAERDRLRLYHQS